MTRRLRKKIAYAVGFFAVLGVIIGIPIIVQLSQVERVPEPSAGVYLPVVIERTDVISQQSGSDIIARLKNPNPTAGIAEYEVEFIAEDDNGQVVAERSVTTYFAPGAVQYVIALSIPVLNPATVRLNVPAAPVFTEIPAAVSMPQFSVFLRERTEREVGASRIQEQKGVVRNVSSLDWQRVEITGVAVASDGQPLGVGQTFVGELKTGEQREFTLQWPAPVQEPAQVLVVPSTNIYLEENIVKILGDPSLLR